MIFVLSLFLSLAHAADRQVIGGDILYQATADDADRSTAQFLAQQAAIKQLITECGIAHRDIKLYTSDVRPSAAGGYHAESSAGLPFEDCHEGKRATGLRKSVITSQETVKNQAMYDKYLAEKMGINKPKVRVVDNAKEFKALQDRFDQMSELLQQQPAPQVVVERYVVIQTPDGKPVTQPQSPTRKPTAECKEELREMGQELARIQAEEGYGGNEFGSKAMNYREKLEAKRRKCWGM